VLVDHGLLDGADRGVGVVDGVGHLDETADYGAGHGYLALGNGE